MLPLLASWIAPWIAPMILSAATQAASPSLPNTGDIPGRLPTKLTAAEVAREVEDEQRYPNMMRYLKTVDIRKGMRPSDPRNKHLIPTSHVFTPTTEMWSSFWKAAVADKLTVLRAFALFSREVKKQGIVVFGPGENFEHGVKDNHIDLGLALPAEHIGTGIWTPDPGNSDPEFQLHLKVFYTESYVHKFPDDILPANLKIGFGEEQTYWMNGKEYRQRTVDADIYYGPTKGVGFRNVKGIGGQKRGVMGFFQKMLFFLPDAVDSMTIDEKKGAMVTEALVDTTVENFEKEPKYAIKVRE